MQDPPSLLPEFVKLWEQGYEIVYGIRATRSEGWVMRSIRRVYYRIISKFSYVAFPPDVGDFQLVDRKVLDAMRKTEDAYPFMRMMTFEIGFVRWACDIIGWRARRVFQQKLLQPGGPGAERHYRFTTVPLRVGALPGNGDFHAQCVTLSSPC
ncbi:MAG: hypothetical protein U1E93_08495 [Alphaproteobacteria bacterium]